LQLEEDGRQGGEGVGRNVDLLQLTAVDHLGRQGGHSVGRQIKLCDKVEVERELGWYLCDDIVTEVAGDEACVPHQVEHSIRHLHQLTPGQVQISAILLGAVSVLNN